MDNDKKWYLRKEIWGVGLTLLSFSPEIIDTFVQAGLLKDYTLIAKLALPLGLILNVLGLRKGYKAENLPSGIMKVMDKIPDKYTGTRN